MTKYISERGAGEITAQQYIMEQFLILLAQQEHSALPDFFWKLDKYKKLWKRHIRSLIARIKEYGEIPIIRALKDKKLNRLRSLDKKASFIWKPVFEKYKKEYEMELEETINNQHLCNINVEEINPNKRRNLNNSNGLEKLRSLDF